MSAKRGYRRRLMIVVVVFVAFAMTGYAGKTRYVSPTGTQIAPYTNWARAARSIQAAVGLSVAGDTVIVSNGTYAITNHITVPGGVWLTSQSGPAGAVILGNGMGRCVNMPQAGAGLKGFTVTGGGNTSDGAGVYCYAGTIVNCVISNNHAIGDEPKGGGVYCDGGIVSNCLVKENSAESTNSYVYGAFAAGGGIYAVSQSQIDHCVVEGNTLTAYYANGAGINANNGRVDYCIVDLNTAYGRYYANGGGVYITANVNGRLRNCLVAGNRAYTDRGAFTVNTAQGGGVFFNSGGDLQSCTISGNSIDGDYSKGGGLSCGAHDQIVNTIISGNEATAHDGIDGTEYYPNPTLGSEPTFDHCLTGGAPGFAGGNYRLDETLPSVCINAGTNVPWMATSKDLDGNPRIHFSGNCVDIGAYECDPRTNETTVAVDVTPDSGSWVMTACAATYDGPTNGIGDLLPTNAPEGTYAVKYEELGTYWTPAPQVFAIAEHDIVKFTGVFTGSCRRPILSWKTTKGATWYQLWISRNGTTYMQTWLSQTTGTWIASTDYPAGTYTWWVRPYVPSTGNGSWSSVATFTIKAKLPGPVTLISPLVMAPAGTVAYKWTAATNATQYELWINKNGAKWVDKWCNTGLRTGQVTNSVSSHTAGASYSWYVRSWDPDGYGPWSSAKSFVCGKCVPTAPVGGSIVSTNRPELTWLGLAAATDYEVCVNRNGTKYLGQKIGSAATAWTPSSSCTAGSYQWWVRDIRGSTVGIWSAPASFTLIAPIAGVPFVSAIGTTENAGTAGSRPSIATDSDGQPHVVVQGTTGVLRMYDRVGGTWRTPVAFTNWTQLNYPRTVIDQNNNRQWISSVMKDGTVSGNGISILTRSNVNILASAVNSARDFIGDPSGVPLAMIDLDVTKPDLAYVYGRAGYWKEFGINADGSIDVTRTLGRKLITKDVGERMMYGFRISPAPDAGGSVWHASYAGDPLVPAITYNGYANDARTEIAWSDPIFYSATGGAASDNYQGLGVDAMSPLAAYFAIYGRNGKVYVNVYEGTNLLYASTAPLIMSSSSSSVRYPPQWATAPDGGAWLCWENGGRIYVRFFGTDGVHGSIVDVCTGTVGTIAADGDGNLHLVYMDGGYTRYRKLSVDCF